MTWREYHQATKHTSESLRRTEHSLDWANMPDPFRHYEGVPLIDLPAIADNSEPARSGADFLSQLLFYSAAISATKLVPGAGYRYALRVNPSSGNLHPTEFHFAASGLAGWPDGLYHYRASSHMAEQRASGEWTIPFTGPQSCLVFVLTTIAWREAWKYRDRAYRYCLHDIGHAWQSLAMSAGALNCTSFAIGHFADADVAKVLGVPEDEWPMLIVRIEVPPAFRSERRHSERTWHGGRPNPLSAAPLRYESIEAIQAATKVLLSAEVPPVPSRPEGSGNIALPEIAVTDSRYCLIARRRRSALNFVPGESISLAQLAALLSATAQPFSADFAGTRMVQLYLYAHRVDGLSPGLYRYWPESGSLELLGTGDQRVAAAGLSLGQTLAGNACVAFSMIADLERATEAYGDRGYRYVHFEAGAIGQRLYLAAEGLGFGATGIGAFFDDEVHRYLGLDPQDGQVVYHFAVGRPVADPRIAAE